MRSNRIPAFILYFAVAASPFPFGSTDPAVIAFWCGLLGIGVVASSTSGLTQFRAKILAGLGIIIFSYFVVLHEQLSNSPLFAQPHQIWLDTSRALEVPLQASVSVARNVPFFALGAPLAAILTFTLSLLICGDRDRARTLLWVFSWSGAFYAALGIALFLTDPSMVLWREKQAYRDVLTATFINRNTAAVYFGSAAIAWLSLLFESVRRNSTEGGSVWNSTIAKRVLSDPTPETAISFSMLFVVLAAMFMTSSRAGILISLGGLMLVCGLQLYRYLPRKRFFLALFFCGLLGLLLIEILGPGFAHVSTRRG